ncbi:MAG: DedA family protein [Terriglobia bacterium]|jgi:membrane protein DedA with SNARE-associated domain
MITGLIEKLSVFIIASISLMGYWGIMAMMAIESACIPLPSEVIMPFSGYLVFTGRFDFWLVGLAGAVGCNVGSAAAYYVGAHGGRPLIEKYGKYVLLSHDDLEWADRWFTRYGEATVFFSRLLPVIRTFIAFPAGIVRMNLLRFHLYTFAGSLPWCLLLTYAGMKLGARWTNLRIYFHRLDLVLGVLILLGLLLFAKRHWGRVRGK